MPNMQEFQYIISSFNAELLEEWKGVQSKHAIKCFNGHTIWRTPETIARSVRKGHGICLECNADILWKRFISQIESLGGMVLETQWKGILKPHKVRCFNGHLSWPRPNNINSGHNMCIICAGKDTHESMNRFIQILERSGSVCLDDWHGSHNIHKIECALNHINHVRPHDVMSGKSVICRECSGRIHNVVYVLQNYDNQSIKFGITNGTGNVRLNKHMQSGYGITIYLHANLPSNQLADRIERAIKRTLKNVGYIPIYGYEYFSIECLPIILEVINKMLEIEDSEHV